MTQHSIVVAGAGYAGMMAAVSLSRRTRRQNTDITLVNPSARFVERLRLHQIAAGQRLPDHQIPDLLKGTGIRFVQAAVTAIDTGRREVAVGPDDAWLPYDTLVYAVGSLTSTSVVPGVSQHAHTLNGLAAAEAFAALLPEARSVTVCGGGLTGVEAATEIAESHPGCRVSLVSASAPGSMMGLRALRHLHRGFERLGVEVVAARVVAVHEDRVELADGGPIASDLTLWTSGVEVPSLAGAAGIKVDEHGRVLTDAGLRSVSHPEVYAVGDAAAVSQGWGVVHGTCQSGIPTGAFVAEEIARRLRGRSSKRFRFGYIHQPVSIGRRDAVIQFTHADDTPRRGYLAGRAAVLYKQMVSSSPIHTYRLARRLKVPARALSSSGGRVTRRGAVGNTRM